MVLDTGRARALAALVNAPQGLVDRTIFYDPDIYQAELEQIFARAWLFMCHESMIPNTGDFYLNYMGEDRVIVVRDEDGGVNVLLNSCRHRGNAVCRAEEGNASSFMCTYHGWTYDLKGALVGVPGFKEVYHEELDREAWGLPRVPKVASYKGFVFANMDADAPDLYDYLGEAGRFGIDMLADQGEMVAVPGVIKYTIQANWKFPSDNTPDFYHGGISHASAFMSGYSQSRTRPRKPGDNGEFVPGYTMLAEYGHGLAGPKHPEDWQEKLGDGAANDWLRDPERLRRLGPIGALMSGSMLNVFPNLFVPAGARQVAIRMPKGPTTSEIWYFSFIDKNSSEEVQREHRFRAAHTFGASGMLEQDDGENWDQSTRGTKGAVASRYPLHYGMGLGHGEIIEDELSPPRIEKLRSEHAQLWHYRAWSEWMAARDWDDLRANHSKPTGTV